MAGARRTTTCKTPSRSTRPRPSTPCGRRADSCTRRLRTTFITGRPILDSQIEIVQSSVFRLPPKFDVPQTPKLWVWRLVLAEGCDPGDIQPLRTLAEQAALNTIRVSQHRSRDGAPSVAVREALGKGHGKGKGRGRQRSPQPPMAQTTRTRPPPRTVEAAPAGAGGELCGFCGRPGEEEAFRMQFAGAGVWRLCD